MARHLQVAVVRVSVRDVSELDAPAVTLATCELRDVHVPAAGFDLAFSVEADVDDPTRSYVARAHADVNGNGRVERGDLVTTSLHAVGPSRYTGLLLPVEPVGS